MEAEERPKKMQKRSHDDANPPIVISPLNHADNTSLMSNNGIESREHKTPDVKDATNQTISPDGTAAAKDAHDEANLKYPDTKQHNINPLTAKQSNHPFPNSTDLPPIPTVDESGNPLSKNARKKLLRAQRWEADRESRKAIKKEKLKAYRERKRERTAALAATGDPNQAADRKRRVPTQLPVTFIFDCGFDELMSAKEIVSLTAQVTRSYSDNKYAAFRAHMCISSFGGRMKERLDDVMMGHYKGWKGVRMFEEDFVHVAERAGEWMSGKGGGKIAGALATHANSAEKLEHGDDVKGEEAEAQEDVPEATGEQDEAPEGVIEVKAKQEHTPKPATEVKREQDKPPKDASDGAEAAAAEVQSQAPASKVVDDEASPTASAPKGDIIYLTSDSEHTLTHLSPHSVYIFGGIVDKNRYKNLCYDRASKCGIKTARLPIGDYMTMNSRKVLTTNHVNEIMLKWFELGDWGQAFMSVIPKRKGGELKGAAKSEDGGDREEEDNDDDAGEYMDGDETGNEHGEAEAVNAIEDVTSIVVGDRKVERQP